MEFDSWFTIGGAEGVFDWCSTHSRTERGLSTHLTVEECSTPTVYQMEVVGTQQQVHRSFTDANNQILLAQLTVDEGTSIDVTLSLIWRDASNVSHVEIGLTAAIGDSGVGCMDSTACNYDEAATEIGDCIYADSACLTCSGKQ